MSLGLLLLLWCVVAVIRNLQWNTHWQNAAPPPSPPLGLPEMDCTQQAFHLPPPSSPPPSHCVVLQHSLCICTGADTTARRSSVHNLYSFTADQKPWMFITSFQLNRCNSGLFGVNPRLIFIDLTSVISCCYYQRSLR